MFRDLVNIVCHSIAAVITCQLKYIEIASCILMSRLASTVCIFKCPPLWNELHTVLFAVHQKEMNYCTIRSLLYSHSSLKLTANVFTFFVDYAICVEFPTPHHHNYASICLFMYLLIQERCNENNDRQLWQNRGTLFDYHRG